MIPIFIHFLLMALFHLTQFFQRKEEYIIDFLFINQKVETM